MCWFKSTADTLSVANFSAEESISKLTFVTNVLLILEYFSLFHNHLLVWIIFLVSLDFFNKSAITLVLSLFVFLFEKVKLKVLFW